MGRPLTPETEVRRRRETWRRVRQQCRTLKNSDVARMLERSEETVKSYSKASGTVPPWDAIKVLQAYSLDAAVERIVERYGTAAVIRITGDAR